MPSRPPLGLGSGLLLALAIAACTDSEPPPSGPAIASGVTHIEIPLAVNRQLDVLFVINSSPGIASQRAKLLDSYRRFMEALEFTRGGLPDLHIGVVTADVGTRGPADQGPGPTIGTGPGSCTSDGDRGELRRVAAIDGNFISDITVADGVHERNYTGSLADAFQQLADVGDAGCTYVRPLEAARRALANNPANAGFLRKDAALGIVVITNTDDCSFGSSDFTGGQLDRSRCTANAGSLVTVAEYVSFFKSLKIDPAKVLLLGAFEPLSGPTCADASPALRLDTLLNGGFPNRSTLVSICEPDLAPLMAGLMPNLIADYGAPCLDPPPLDVDPATDGLQVDCAAWYRYSLDGALTEKLIPACVADEPGPCWRIIDNSPNCIPPTKWVDFRNQRRFGPDADALVIMECVSSYASR
jgi:hypothetical protein